MSARGEIEETLQLSALRAQLTGELTLKIRLSAFLHSLSFRDDERERESASTERVHSLSIQLVLTRVLSRECLVLSQANAEQKPFV